MAKLTVLEKIKKMKSGSVRYFDTVRQANVFRTLVYQAGKIPRKNDGKIPVYVFDKDKLPESSS